MLRVGTYRPGDPVAVSDQSTLLRRALWPLAGKVFRRGVVPGRLRTAALRRFGATIGDGVVIESDVRVPRPWLVRVDGPAWIGEGARIEHRGAVTVEPDVCIAPGARIGSGERDRAPITVGSGAWVGPNARILPGAKIGRGAVLARRVVVGGTVEAGHTITPHDAS
jgi:putative colanic acid biosynthesis acetyltransferase WcaF